jgi:hypothetical protein
VLADQVLGQRDPLGAGHRVRLVLGEPRDDGAGHAGRPRVAESGEHIAGKRVPERAHHFGTRVGPEHRRADRSPVLGDEDGAVHLSGDTDRSNVVPLRQRHQQVVDGLHPPARVRLHHLRIGPLQRPCGLQLGE